MPDTISPTWNGEPCEADLGTVVCGAAQKPTWWCAGREGERMQCVRVRYADRTFFLYDGDGSGSHKVFMTEGYWNSAPHQSIPVDDPSTFQPEDDARIQTRQTPAPRDAGAHPPQRRP